MLLWGGNTNQFGTRYNPRNDGWNSMTVGPVTRHGAHGEWNGTNMLLYLPALPTGNLRLFRCLNGGTFLGAVAINSSGNISLLDSGGTSRATSSTVLPTNAWFRLEGYLIGNASTGQIQCEIFTTMDSATPTETVTTAATINTASTVTIVAFGNPSSITSYTLYMDDIAVSSAGYMGPVITLTSTFQGGTSGTTITTGNSGPPSGNAFDNVAIGTGASVTYDSTVAAHGTLSAKFATGGTATTSLTEWTTTMGTQTTVYFRMYVYLPAVPPNAGFRAFNARSGANHAGSVLFTPGGTIQLAVGSGFTAVKTFVTPPPAGAWFRIEGYVTGDASAGAISASLYTTLDSTTAVETQTSTGQNTVGALTAYWFGQGSSVASSGPFWLDDVGISNSAYLGPVLSASNNFEGGTQGTTLTTANTGGASGNAFDNINSTNSPTIAFDNTHVANGALACKLATTTATTPLAEWTSNTLGTQTQVWYRQYLYLTGIPASAIRTIALRSNGALAAAIGISLTGKLQLINSASGVATTLTHAIPLNAWFRIEGYIVGDPAAGVISCSMYAAPYNSTSPVETKTATSQNTGGVLNQYWFGEQVSIANLPSFWMDDIGISNFAALGPSAAVKASGSGTSIVPSLIAAGAI